MDIRKRNWVLVLTFIGLAFTLELIWVYWNANFAVNSAPSICAINNFVNCDDVAKTVYSQFLGVPLACWGLFLYSFILLLCFVDKLKNIKLLSFLEVFKNPLSYIYSLGLLSFFISMSLAIISIFNIGSICVFCFCTYFIDLGIALIAKSNDKGLIEDIKISILDFKDAILVKKYAISFSVVMIIFAIILFVLYKTAILAPQLADYRKFQAYMKEISSIVKDNVLGDKDASIVIREFVDYNCAGCYLSNLSMHRLVSEVNGVRIEQNNLPLEKECNYNMKVSGHKGSCIKAKYALAAKKQGKYWQMNDLLFENMHSITTEQDILRIVKGLDFNVKQLQEDANSEEVLQEIHDGIKKADEVNVDATPTVFIGYKRFLGAQPYYELKQIVLDMGAKEK